jgi:hypothetical protein
MIGQYMPLMNYGRVKKGHISGENVIISHVTHAMTPTCQGFTSGTGAVIIPTIPNLEVT